MASNQSKLKRRFPLLLALVILISCLPVIPVSAAAVATLTIDGEVYHSHDFSSLVGSFKLTASWLDRDTISFACSLCDGFVYTYPGNDQFLGLRTSGGSLMPDSVSEIVVMSGSPANLSVVTEAYSSYTTTIYLDGETYLFSNSGSASPDVSMSIDSSGCTMTSGETVYRWNYSGSGTFTGFSTSFGGSVDYSVGSTVELPGQDEDNAIWSFFPVAETPAQTYTTKITIDDHTFTFTGTGSSPLVSMTVDIDGCTLSDGENTYQYTYSGSGTFKGFSSSAGGSVNYSIGSTWTFGGKTGVDSQYALYPFAETSVQIYYSTINIGSSQFVFSSTVSTPKVTITVNDTGASLSDGSKTFTYTYSGEGTFQGLSFSATGAASLVPGESYPLAAGNHTLYAIASTSSGGDETVFTTTVVIDDKHFVFSGTAEASPDVSMTVTETGAILTYGTVTYQYPYTGSGVYLGLTLPGGSDIIYPIGTTATLGGADGADVLFTLIPASASETYTKVTQNLADWTGTYLIVYEVSETEGYVFTGVDEKLNSVLTQLVDGNIVTSASDLAFCPVRIEPYGSGYSIKLLSGVNVGKYIYASPSGYNDILFSDEPQQLTISHDGTTVHILDGEAPFQFNKSSSYLWFRFFAAKPGGQSEIALYKLDDGSSGGEFVLSAGQWEANKSLASATNEYLSLSDWPEGLNPVALSFISNGQSYSSISYRYSLEFGYSLFFDDTRVYGYDILAAISDPGWQSDAYALIYFAEDQIVSSEFYAWFTSNFCRIGDDSVSPTYSTTINIYDASGLVLQRSYKFSGLVAPGVAFLVTETGCQIFGDGLTYTWVSLADEFYGFSLTENSEYAVYKPGQYYTLPGGSAMDLIFNLYEVSEDPVNSGSHDVQAVLSGFVASFITPVMAFFNTEFIPGFSFGKMALVAFLFGLLFWLLKVSK